jgi:hypothetical protein
MMFVSVVDDFTNLRHLQDAKLVFEPECIILEYQSCEASIQSIGPMKDRLGDQRDWGE